MHDWIQAAMYRDGAEATLRQWAWAARPKGMQGPMPPPPAPCPRNDPPSPSERYEAPDHQAISTLLGMRDPHGVGADLAFWLASGEPQFYARGSPRPAITKREP